MKLVKIGEEGYRVDIDKLNSAQTIDDVHELADIESELRLQATDLIVSKNDYDSLLKQKEDAITARERSVSHLLEKSLKLDAQVNHLLENNQKIVEKSTTTVATYHEKMRELKEQLKVASEQIDHLQLSNSALSMKVTNEDSIEKELSELKESYTRLSEAYNKLQVEYETLKGEDSLTQSAELIKLQSELTTAQQENAMLVLREGRAVAQVAEYEKKIASLENELHGKDAEIDGLKHHIDAIIKEYEEVLAEAEAQHEDVDATPEDVGEARFVPPHPEEERYLEED